MCWALPIYETEDHVSKISRLKNLLLSICCFIGILGILKIGDIFLESSNPIKETIKTSYGDNVVFEEDEREDGLKTFSCQNETYLYELNHNQTIIYIYQEK